MFTGLVTTSKGMPCRSSSDCKRACRASKGWLRNAVMLEMFRPCGAVGWGRASEGIDYPQQPLQRLACTFGRVVVRSAIVGFERQGPLITVIPQGSQLPSPVDEPAANRGPRQLFLRAV